LLVSEGLARKVDIDAALEIQQGESPDNRSGGLRDQSEGIRKTPDGCPGVPHSSPSGDDSKSERTIGRILCDLNLVSPIDLGRVLKKYQKQLRLGEILLREGSINANQLEDALYEQQTQLQPLGYILIRKGWIDMDRLYSALSVQYNIPYKRFQRFRYTEQQKHELSRVVGKNFVQENLILPVLMEGAKLTLAVYMPEKMMCIHELRRIYVYRRMDCVLIRPDVFQDLFTQLYGAPIALDAAGFPETIYPAASGDDPLPEGASSAVASAHNGESEISQTVNDLLKHAVDTHATSIHIEQDRNGPVIRCRVNGMLETLKLPGFEHWLPETAGALLACLKTMAGLDRTETRTPQQGACTVRIHDGEPTQGPVCDVRVATWSTAWGENATLHISDANRTDLDLDHLNHPVYLLNPLKKILDDAEGILLFSGRPGSGRRTSLYAAAYRLLRSDIKMIAIEDTIRARKSGMVQIQIDNRLNLGADTLLRMSSNHDPDVILVTSMQNRKTAEAAFDIAPGGPFILGATVAEDAVETLLRLRAFGIEADRIAQSLKAVLAQRRVKRICRVCGEPYLPDPDEWRTLFDTYPQHVSFYRGRGCESCRFSGYDGFIVISELLIVDDALRAAVQKGADARELRQVAVRSGFKTMAEDALSKLNQTTVQELLKIGANRFKGARTSGGDSPPPEAAGSLPAAETDAIDTQTWDIGSLENDAGAIDDMYEAYWRLKKLSGRQPISDEAGFFHEFIAASFYHICRHYGCRRVRFRIENSRGRAEITASPIRTAQQDR